MRTNSLGCINLTTTTTAEGWIMSCRFWDIFQGKNYFHLESRPRLCNSIQKNGKIKLQFNFHWMFLQVQLWTGSSSPGCPLCHEFGKMSWNVMNFVKIYMKRKIDSGIIWPQGIHIFFIGNSIFHQSLELLTKFWIMRLKVA